jgi:hypothetical protein
MFAARRGHRHTAFSLTQVRDDLRLVYLPVFIQNIHFHRREKILLMQSLAFGVDYPDFNIDTIK